MKIAHILSIFIFLVFGGFASCEAVRTTGSIFVELYKKVDSLQASAPLSYVDAQNESLSDGQYYVSFDRIPAKVRDAFLSAEDKSFYQHWGFSIQGISRAFLYNLKNGGYTHGGSTITQQLAKRSFVGSEKNFTRKLKELFYALALEARLSKNDILELYLNSLYFGSGYIGVYQASQGYFNKELANLSLKEAALLAAIIKAPSRFSLTSRRGYAKASRRARYVLRRMFEDGYIDKRSLLQAIKEKPPVAVSRSFIHRDIVNFVRGRLKKLPTISAGNRRLTLTVDGKLGEGLFAAIASMGLEHYPNIQLTAVVVDPFRGEIKAIQGSKNPELSEFNRATQTKRPIGAMALPFVAAVALEQGVVIEQIHPRSRGSLYDALMGRDPFPLSAVVADLGLGTYRTYWRRMGFSDPVDDFSFLLGQERLSLVELTKKYAALFRGGLFRKLKILSSTQIQSTNIGLGKDALFLLRSSLSHHSDNFKGFRFHSSDGRNLWLIQEWEGNLLGVWVGVEGRKGRIPLALEAKLLASFASGKLIESPYSYPIHLRWVPLNTENSGVFLPHLAVGQSKLGSY